MKLLIENWRRYLKEEQEALITKLRVFDFDDTLIHTLSKIKVVNPETREPIIDPETEKEKVLRQGELKAYEKTKGEEFDYSEFVKPIPKGTKPIKPIAKIFRYMVEHPVKDRKVMIITARMAAAEFPIKDYLEKLGIDISDVEVVGTEGESKAPYVQRELDGMPDVNNFIMFDDSVENLEEVGKMLKENFPDIEVELRRPRVKGGKLIDIPIFKAPETSEVVE